MIRPALSRALVATTLVAGLLSLPAAAHASGPLAALPTAFSAAIAAAPCLAGGVAPADHAIADHLRPAMTGRRLGRSVTGYSISCARAVVRAVQSRGLVQRAAVLAVTTAITESTLHNYTVAVDHDSHGLFQQRPSKGWGRPGQLVDPGYATAAFLNALIRKHPGDSWLTGDVGEICQRVQVSAYPGAYTPEEHDARLIVGELWPSIESRALAAPAVPAPTKPAAPTRSTARFARELLPATGTGLAATDGRHDVSLADWNGDRRPDLVVVDQSGATSGRTEVHVLDGASNFQRYLLRTGTLLGPTDGRYAFAVADWNGDARPDLVVLQKSGTASGHTEVKVLDGASFFQKYLLETATALGPTDDRHAVAVADWNADGRPDLVVTQKSGTASRHVELTVLDGASSFQTVLQQSTTAQGTLDARHDVAIADWNGDQRPDLVVLQKSGAASGHVELTVFDGATNFRKRPLTASTAQAPTDDRYDLSVADWDGDGKPDLVVVQKSGTASGRTEAHVLAG